MKDLTFLYKTKDGETDFRAYTTIMDFTDYIEVNPDTPLLEGAHVKAVFFENPLQSKEFNTIKELYNHCINILS